MRVVLIPIRSDPIHRQFLDGTYHQLIGDHSNSNSNSNTKGFYHSQWTSDLLVTLQVTNTKWTLIEWSNDGILSNRIWTFNGSPPSFDSQPITFISTGTDHESIELQVHATMNTAILRSPYCESLHPVTTGMPFKSDPHDSAGIELTVAGSSDYQDDQQMTNLSERVQGVSDQQVVT